MRDLKHTARNLLQRAGLAVAAASLASACAFDPVAGVPNLLANREAQCDIGPSWNETPMRDVGEVRLIWRYHNENEWQGVCDTSGWGCIRCRWDQGERVCTVDLRIRPRFSQLCHMAVLGHELGHALGKMHDEPQVRVIPVSFIPANTQPASAPDSSPVSAPSVNAMRDEEETIAAVSLEPLPELTPPRLFEMLERVNRIELANALTDRKEASGGMVLRLDRAQSFFASLR